MLNVLLAAAAVVLADVVRLVQQGAVAVAAVVELLCGGHFLHH
jgi:hypothetical protein